MFKKFILKTCVLILIFSFLRIGFTRAEFVNEEKSTDNELSASTLDFSLRDAGGVILTSPYFNITDMKPGDNQTKYFRIKKEGLLDFKYQLSAAQTGGDLAFCTALLVEAKLDSVVQYSGSLLGLTLSPLLTISGGQDDWDIKVSLSDASSTIQNKTCNFNLQVRSWQTDSDGTWGFGDEETLVNSVTSGTWALSNNVVINEIMWMGSIDSEHLDDDEWIELRNTTGSPVDLTGWKIDGAGSGSGSITLSGTIPANGFFLLSHYSSDHSAINDSISVDQVIPGVSLANGGEQLTLKDASNNIIDQTPSGVWVAGINGTEKQSMERNDDPATGWHACIAAACHSTTFWDSDGHNWGTPKVANLSANDPSSSDFVMPPAPTETLVSPFPAAVEPTPTVTLEQNSELLASPSATTVESAPTLTPTIIPETTPSPIPIEQPTLTATPTEVPTEQPILTSPLIPVESSVTPSPEPTSLSEAVPSPVNESSQSVNEEIVQ